MTTTTTTSRDYTRKTSSSFRLMKVYAVLRNQSRDKEVTSIDEDKSSNIEEKKREKTFQESAEVAVQRGAREGTLERV